jgi:hypothetical protein
MLFYVVSFNFATFRNISSKLNEDLQEQTRLTERKLSLYIITYIMILPNCMINGENKFLYKISMSFRILVTLRRTTMMQLCAKLR